MTSRLTLGLTLAFSAGVVACGSNPDDTTGADVIATEEQDAALSDLDAIDVAGADDVDTRDAEEGDAGLGDAAADGGVDVGEPEVMEPDVPDPDTQGGDASVGDDASADTGDDALEPTDTMPDCGVGQLVCDGDTVLEQFSNEACDDRFVGVCEFGCADGDCLTQPDCRIRTMPEIGEWTAEFVPDTACDCTEANATTCHTLWQSRIVSVDEDANTAVLEYRKMSDGSGPSVDVSYWIVPSTRAPTCLQLEAQPERETGTWPAGIAPLQIEVAMWASRDEFERADNQDRVNLSFISGGGGGFETQRVWWTPSALSFVKECGE